ncbi:MAG: hypothetical protein M9962_09565 [Oligoflexia bacterium]|nr:hypothetical protein [Oligoflexia bacterium]
MVKLSLAIAFSLLANFSYAADGFQACMDEEKVISLYVDAKAGSELVIPLPSRSSRGSWVTNAISSLAFNSTGFQMRFTFPLPRDQVSIPYNIYHAQVSTIAKSGEDIANHVQDFTDECRGPGISVFPGGEVKLLPIKYTLPDDKKGESLKVQIWGHL